MMLAPPTMMPPNLPSQVINQQYDGVMANRQPHNAIGGFNRQIKPVDPSIVFADYSHQLSRVDLKYLSAKLQECEYDAGSYFNTQFAIMAANAWRSYFGYATPQPETYSNETGRVLMTATDRMVEVLMRATFDQQNLLAFEPLDNIQPENPLMRRIDANECYLMGRHIEHTIRSQAEARAVLEKWALNGLVEGIAFLRVESYSPPDEIERKTNLSWDEFIILLLDPSTEIVHWAQDQDFNMPRGVKYHAITKRKKPRETIIQHIPTSQMLWQKDCTTFDQTLPYGPSYLAQAQILPANEIIRQIPGSEAAVMDGDGDTTYENIQSDLRETIFSNESGDLYSGQRWGDNPFEGRSLRTLNDEYVKFDLDGDGVDELVCIRRIGHRILYVCPVADNPFVWWTPKESPARAVGQSLYDKLSDIEDQNTDLTRAILNMTSLLVNPRTVVNMTPSMNSDISPEETIQDLEKGGVGGIVRAGGDPSAYIGTHTDVDPNSIQFTQLIKQMVMNEGEERIGLSQAIKGSADPSVGRTATGMHIAQQSGSMPAMSIVASYGSGLERLAKKTLRCEINNSNAILVKVNGQEIEADPRYWRYDMRCSVNVSGALLNPDQRIAHLMQIMNAGYPAMEALGIDNDLYNLMHHGNALKELVRTMAFKDTGRFVGEVTPEKMAEYAEKMAQASQEANQDPSKMAKVEADYQIDMLKLEMEMMQMQQENQMKMLEIYIQAEQKDRQIQVEAALEASRMKMEEKLEQAKIKSNEKVGMDKNKKASVGRPVSVGGKKTG